MKRRRSEDCAAVPLPAFGYSRLRSGRHLPLPHLPQQLRLQACWTQQTEARFPTCLYMDTKNLASMATFLLAFTPYGNKSVGYKDAGTTPTILCMIHLLGD